MWISKQIHVDALVALFIPQCPMFPCRAKASQFPLDTYSRLPLYIHISRGGPCSKLINSDIFVVPPSTGFGIREKEPLHFLHPPFAIWAPQKGFPSQSGRHLLVEQVPERELVLRFSRFWHAFWNLFSFSLLFSSLLPYLLWLCLVRQSYLLPACEIKKLLQGKCGTK